MKLLVVVSEYERAQDVRNALLKLDVRGVTVISGQGMPGSVSQEPPIFGGVPYFLFGPTERNRIVFGITDREDILKEIDVILRDADVKSLAPHTGCAFTLQVEGIIEASREGPSGQRKRKPADSGRPHPFLGDRR